MREKKLTDRSVERVLKRRKNNDFFFLCLYTWPALPVTSIPFNQMDFTGVS